MSWSSFLLLVATAATEEHLILLASMMKLTHMCSHGDQINRPKEDTPDSQLKIGVIYIVVKYQEVFVHSDLGKLEFLKHGLKLLQSSKHIDIALRPNHFLF